MTSGRILEEAGIALFVKSPIGDRPGRHEDRRTQPAEAIEDLPFIGSKAPVPDGNFVDVEAGPSASDLHRHVSLRNRGQGLRHRPGMRKVIDPDRGRSFAVLDQDVVPPFVHGEDQSRLASHAIQVGHHLSLLEPHVAVSLDRDEVGRGLRLGGLLRLRLFSRVLPPGGWFRRGRLLTPDPERNRDGFQLRQRPGLRRHPVAPFFQKASHLDLAQLAGQGAGQVEMTLPG